MKKIIGFAVLGSLIGFPATANQPVQITSLQSNNQATANPASIETVKLEEKILFSTQPSERSSVNQLTESTPLQLAANVSEVDPRLFINATRLNQIKSAILVPGSHHQQAFLAMKARVDQNNWQAYKWSQRNTGRSHLAREASFMYLLTDDPKYAQIAYQALFDIHNNSDPSEPIPESGSDGLRRALIGENFAIAYDWAYKGWTDLQRNYIKNKIDLALNAWPSYYHANLTAPSYGSNWVAVCRGSELIMILAVREEQARASRYSQLKNWLNLHLQNGYGNLGVTQEGIGYASYAGSFLIPAIYALRSVGDTSLDATFNSKAFWKQVMYAGAFTMHDEGQRQYLQSGVSGVTIYDEGWVSLLLGAVPQDQLPYYRYFYDRQMGVDAPGTIDQKFDAQHGGTVWALIYYPENLTSINPTSIFQQAVSDDNKGAYFFRNRWQNGDDILISIMADAQRHSRAWDQSEAFSLGMIAGNTQFIGGAGKQLTNPNVVSALLVDGKAQISNSQTGKPEFFSATSNGGYVIVDGDLKYSSLGLNSAKRHLLVDFSKQDGTALLSTLDRLQDDTSHTYTWQLNIGDDLSNGGVSVTTGKEGVLSTFTLTGKNNSYVKGWILNPTNASVIAGDPLKVTTSGSNANIWVAMVTGKGVPPVGTVTGTGMNAVLSVGNLRVYYNANTNRIVTTRL